MARDKQPTRLRRILARPLWGKAKPVKERRKFEELSHSEQQEALLRGERQLRFLLLLFLFKGSIAAMIWSLLVGLAFRELVDWPLTSFILPDAPHPTGLLLKVALGWIALLVSLYALVRFGGRPARWAIARWPRRLAVWYTDEEQRLALQLTDRWVNVAILCVVIPFLTLASILTASISTLVIFVPVLLVIAVAYYGCIPAGTEPCCRECAYSLPIDESLPTNCSECGVELAGPWGRRLGRSRKTPLWRAVMLAMWLLPVVGGALMWP